MHELALCGSIADIVRRRAAARRVETIRLQIGQLRQVVPDTLEYCWRLVTAETALAGSVLEIERISARSRCGGCAAEHDMADHLDFVCRACGRAPVQVVAGEEFVITSIDVTPAVSL